MQDQALLCCSMLIIFFCVLTTLHSGCMAKDKAKCLYSDGSETNNKRKNYDITISPHSYLSILLPKTD